MSVDLTRRMQVQIPKDLKSKIQRIARRNRISEAEVIHLCLAQTLPLIAENGLTILPSSRAVESSATLVVD